MEYRSSEIKAGLFIFISFIVLAGMIFMLGNLRDYFKPKRQLRIAFNYTGGLEIGAPVRYAGMGVGRVVNVEISPPNDKTEHMVVLTAIDPAIKIKKDSAAMIKTSGMMGGLYIEIRPGPANAETLAPNETLQGQELFEFTKIGDIMAEFMTNIERFTDITESIAVDSKSTLAALQKSIGNIDLVINENRENLHSNLENMTKITGEVAGVITNKHRAISDIIDQTQRASHEIELLLADARPGVAKLADKADSMADNLEQTLQQTNGVLIENRRNLLELVKNLRETSEAFKEFSEDIKRNPWKLIRKSDEQPDQGKSAPVNSQDSLRMKRLDKVSAK